jgi:tRNA (guanine26-N2/guanine27-N2)-dimethyltransferase
MYETVREGKAIIRTEKAGKISKKMGVFYNPVMKVNRDITILLLRQFPPMNLCDPLAASGIRSIRFARELKYKSITANDLSPRAVVLIKKNMRLNKVKFKVYNCDANLFLLNSSGFDYIDIDPFGTSNAYLDAAIKRISRKGILAVTNTDTAALTGTYPKACARKYWSMPKRDYMMHETGLRILIRKIQLVGMQYEKALWPIFSYFKNHYFRIFFQCLKGKELCDGIAEQHGMFNDAGPLWLGKLWDGKLVNKIYATLIKNPKNDNSLENTEYNNKKLIKKKIKIINNNQNKNELLKFLKIIKDESKISAVGFYDMHQIAKNNKLRTMMRKEDVIRKIKNKGFKASDTHFSGTGVRTNIPYNKLVMMLKE